MENNKKQEEVKRDLLKEQEDRVFPVAQKLIEIMASKKLMMGSNTGEKENQARIDCYMPIYLELMEIFKEKGILLQEVTPLFLYVNQAFQFIKDMTEMSIERNVAKADKYLWKKEEHEISINDLDKILLESEKK